MTTSRYRLASFEVDKNSNKDQSFSDRDVTIFGVLTDPTFPDGTDVRDQSTDEPGPFGVLGFAKHAEPGVGPNGNVRNSTQAEIDTYAAARVDDENQQDAERAADLGDVHKQFRKIFKALLKNNVRENNLNAAQWNAFRAEVAAATSLGDLKTRVANDTQDVPIRTNQQAFDVLRTDVDKDD